MSLLDQIANEALPPENQIPVDNQENQEVEQENQQESQQIEENPNDSANLETQQQEESYNEETQVEDQQQEEVENQDESEQSSTSTEETEYDYDNPFAEDVDSENDDEEDWNENFNEESNQDATLETQEQVQTPSFDSTSMSNALGTQINSVEELTAYVNELKEVKTLGGFANEQIRQANEIAQQGGDFMTFLQGGQVDYSVVSTDDIMIDKALKLMPNWTEEQAQDWVDTLEPSQKEMEAQGIRNQLTQQEQYRVQQVQQQAEQRRVQRLDSTQKHLKGVEEIAGLKLDNKKRKDIFGRLRNIEKYTHELFHDKQGNFDPRKAAYIDVVLREHKGLVKRSQNKGRSEASEEFMNEVQNTNLPNKKPAGQHAGNVAKNQSNNQQKMNPLDRLAAQANRGEKIKTRRTRGI